MNLETSQHGVNVQHLEPSKDLDLVLLDSVQWRRSHKYYVFTPHHDFASALS
jgi:hypothetical protein